MGTCDLVVRRSCTSCVLVCRKDEVSLGKKERMEKPLHGGRSKALALRLGKVSKVNVRCRSTGRDKP